jgi:hypothetical protein
LAGYASDGREDRIDLRIVKGTKRTKGKKGIPSGASGAFGPFGPFQRRRQYGFATQR